MAARPEDGGMTFRDLVARCGIAVCVSAGVTACVAALMFLCILALRGCGVGR